MTEEKHCDFCKGYPELVKNCRNRTCPFGENAETIAYFDKMERLWLKTWKVKENDYKRFCAILHDANYFKDYMKSEPVYTGNEFDYYLYSITTLPEDFVWLDELFKEHNLHLEVTEYYANPFRPMPLQLIKPVTIPNPQTPL